MAKADGSDSQKLVKDERKPTGLTLRDYLDKNELEFRSGLGDAMDVNRFKRQVLTAIRENELLAKCDPISVIGASMTAAQLRLELNTPLGQAYLIPYWDNKRKRYIARFQLGYQGVLDLAWRSEKYALIQARCVYSNDIFEYEYGDTPRLKHVPNPDGPAGEPTYYYASYVLHNGGRNFEVMSRAMVEAHAERYSQAIKKGKDSPWKTAFDFMAMKTCIIRLQKYAPKSVEMVKAFRADAGDDEPRGGNIPVAPPVPIIDSTCEKDEPEEEIEEDGPVTVDMETGEIIEEETIDETFNNINFDMEDES